MAQAQFIESRAVQAEAVRDDPSRLNRLISQKAPKQFERRLGIAPALNDQIQDLALVVHRAPEIHAPPADRADHFVQVPPRRRRWPPFPQAPGDQRTKLDRPAANGFVADLDSALSQQFLDIPKAQAVAEIQPHRMSDHIARKAMAFELERPHEILSPIRPLAGLKWRQVSVRLTAPLAR